MKLVKITLFYIEYKGIYGTESVLIEAENFSEAERLFNMKYENKYSIAKISKYGIDAYRKSIKTINIEV